MDSVKYTTRKDVMRIDNRDLWTKICSAEDIANFSPSALLDEIQELGCLTVEATYSKNGKIRTPDSLSHLPPGVIATPEFLENVNPPFAVVRLTIKD